MRSKHWPFWQRSIHVLSQLWLNGGRLHLLKWELPFRKKYSWINSSVVNCHSGLPSNGSCLGRRPSARSKMSRKYGQLELSFITRVVHYLISWCWRPVCFWLRCRWTWWFSGRRLAFFPRGFSPDPTGRSWSCWMCPSPGCCTASTAIAYGKKKYPWPKDCQTTKNCSLSSFGMRILLLDVLPNHFCSDFAFVVRHSLTLMQTDLRRKESACTLNKSVGGHAVCCSFLRDSTRCVDSHYFSTLCVEWIGTGCIYPRAFSFCLGRS